MKTNTSTFLTSPKRDYHLDLVKALSISLVLILHLKPLRIALDESSSNYSRQISFFIEQIYLNLNFVAVPLFILTSLFLFFQKVNSSNHTYLLNRSKRLLELYFVWTIFHLIVYFIVHTLQSVILPDTLYFSYKNIRIHEVLAGISPPLPLVGDSVFYYIFALILLSFAAYLFSRLATRTRFYVGILIIVLSLIYFEFSNLFGIYIHYWRIDNFLAYIPIAYFFCNTKNNLNNNRVLLLYVLFFVFGFQDIFLRSINQDVPFYGRVSIVCGSTAIFSTCLKLQISKFKGIIKYLSIFSLGIFALHKYCLLIVNLIMLKIFDSANLSSLIPLPGLKIDFVAFISSIGAFCLTLAVIHLLNKTSLQRYIK